MIYGTFYYHAQHHLNWNFFYKFSMPSHATVPDIRSVSHMYADTVLSNLCILNVRTVTDKSSVISMNNVTLFPVNLEHEGGIHALKQYGWGRGILPDKWISLLLRIQGKIAKASWRWHNRSPWLHILYSHCEINMKLQFKLQQTNNGLSYSTVSKFQYICLTLWQHPNGCARCHLIAQMIVLHMCFHIHISLRTIICIKLSGVSQNKY